MGDGAIVDGFHLGDVMALQSALGLDLQFVNPCKLCKLCEQWALRLYEMLTRVSFSCNYSHAYDMPSPFCDYPSPVRGLIKTK